VKSYLKIVPSYIKKYRSRSVAILLSMILSASLIIGVGTLSKSAREENINQTRKELGDLHAAYKDINKNQLDIIRKNKAVEKIGLSSYYGGSDPNFKLAMNLEKVDQNYISMYDPKIIKGRFPSKVGEIALEEWVMKNLQMKPTVGQKFSIKLCEKKELETYTVVGILKDIPSNKSMGAAEGYLALDKESLNEVNAYVKFDEKSNILKNIDRLSGELSIPKNKIGKNSMLIELIGKGEYIDYDVIKLALILALVGGIVIYSIFNISILQRISDYGIIKALGGTSRQIFNLVLFELFLLSLISIPIGTAGGLLTARLLGSVSGGLFTEGQVHIKHIIISKSSIFLFIAVIFAVILIISFKIFYTIKKISSIEAIRKNIDKEEIKNKNIFHDKVLIEQFGISKVVLLKNIFRNKKGFYTTVICMSLGSIIFIVSNFQNVLYKKQDEIFLRNSGMNCDFKITLNFPHYLSEGISDEQLKEIKKLKGVKEGKSVQVLYSRMAIDKDQIGIPEYFKRRNESGYIKTVLKGLLTKNKEGRYTLKQTVFGYDDSSLKDLKDYLAEGEIDVDRMKKGDMALILIPKPGIEMGMESMKGMKTLNIKVGDKVKIRFRKDGEISEEFFKMEDKGEYIEKEFTVGGIIEDNTQHMDVYADECGSLILSQDKFKEMTGFKNYQIVDVNKVKNEDENKLYDDIVKISSRTPGTVVRSFYKEIKEEQVSTDREFAFRYAIVAILFLISVINILNTISYNLTSRSKEFGMMRAIGMTDREFKNMIGFEGILYGIISGITSFVGGLIGQVTLFEHLKPVLTNPQFTIQWGNYILAVCMNIFIGYIVTYIPSRKIKKLSIVESISAVE